MVTAVVVCLFAPGSKIQRDFLETNKDRRCKKVLTIARVLPRVVEMIVLLARGVPG